MALKKNVFTSDLQGFLVALSDFRHYQNFINWQLREARKRFGSSLKVLESQGLQNKYGMGTGLPILDVLHRGQLEVRAPSVKRVTEGPNLSCMATEMERRFNAFLLINLFERLEAYLKVLYGRLLYQMRHNITIANKKAFHKAHPKLKKQRGTLPYCLEYAKYVCRRDCSGAIAEFDKQLAWKRVFSIPWYDMPFDELVETLGLCRHCIIHDEGRITTTKMKKLSKSSAAFVRACLHESLLGKEELLLPDTNTIDKCFEAIASYGYGLYVLLSEQCSMVVDYNLFKRPRNPKKSL